MNLPRRHEAGRSATRRAKAERGAWLGPLRTIRHVLLGVAAATMVLGTVVPANWKYPCGMLGGAIVSLWLYAREASPKAQRWLEGAEGERKTEDALRVLRREGWVIRHDLAAGSGNIDHVAIGPPGVFLLDSKNWSGHVTINGDGIPCVNRSDEPGNRWPRDRIPQQMRRTAREHHAALRKNVDGLRLWVNPVTVLWATFDARAVEAKGVAYVHGDELVDWLRKRQSVYTGVEVLQLAEALRQIPAYEGSEPVE